MMDKYVFLFLFFFGCAELFSSRPTRRTVNQNEVHSTGQNVQTVSQPQQPQNVSSDLCPQGELPHRVTFYVKHGNSSVVTNTAETQAITDDILNLVRQFLTILKQQDFVSLKSLFNSQVRIRVKILSIDPPDFDDFTVTPRNIRSAAIRNHFVGLIRDQGFSEAVSEFCHGVRQPRYPDEEVVSEEIIANRELNRFEYILRYSACSDINTITIKIRKTSSSLKIFGASFIIGWIGCGEDD